MKTYLRAAKEEDVDLLFRWANDSEVRKNAFSTEEISYGEHLSWYKELLSRADCKQYIYIYNDVPIGQIRLTIRGEEAEIDYSVCKEKRGMGHGKRMLQFLCSQVKKEFPDIKKLTAKVKHDNIASQQTFLSAGYNEKYYFFEFII